MNYDWKKIADIIYQFVWVLWKFFQLQTLKGQEYYVSGIKAAV